MEIWIWLPKICHNYDHDEWISTTNSLCAAFKSVHWTLSFVAIRQKTAQLGPLHKQHPFKTCKTVASDGTPSNNVSFLGNVKNLDGGTYKFIMYLSVFTNIMVSSWIFVWNIMHPCSSVLTKMTAYNAYNLFLVLMSFCNCCGRLEDSEAKLEMPTLIYVIVCFCDHDL